jgi:hypothetical protein
MAAPKGVVVGAICWEMKVADTPSAEQRLSKLFTFWKQAWQQRDWPKQY